MFKFYINLAFLGVFICVQLAGKRLNRSGPILFRTSHDLREGYYKSNKDDIQATFSVFYVVIMQIVFIRTY